MTINLHLPTKNETLRPTITVVGVGGAGGNAVNNMIDADLQGVSFVTANTDAQALDNALAECRIQLGSSITQGLGAGASPDVGRAAAEEALDDIHAAIEGSHMVFITAGMGGGTGTGAAPVVARLAREQGILTVGVVTRPFQFEGTHRMKIAELGLEDLQNYVDTMIVIPNQNLFRVANERTTFADAFRMADEVLHSGVRGVTDLMVMPGLINLDFADIRSVMREMGKAMMGTGEAEGDRRAVEAAEAAISNPLLDDVSMKGARGVLINITGGHDMTLFEVDEAANRIRDEVDSDANIIFGSTFHDNMEGRMRVSVVATGIDIKESEKPSTGKKLYDTKSEAQAHGAKGFRFGYTERKEPEKAKSVDYREYKVNDSSLVAIDTGKNHEKRTSYVAAPEAKELEIREHKNVSSAAFDEQYEKKYDTTSNKQEEKTYRGTDNETTSHRLQNDAQAGFMFSEQEGQPVVPKVELRSQPDTVFRNPGGVGDEVLQANSTIAESNVTQQQYGDPGFVVPHPNQASNRSFYQVTEEDREGFGSADKLSPRSHRRQQNEDDGGGGSAFGFLQRMAGRAFSNRDEKPAEEYEQTGKPTGRAAHAAVSEHDGFQAASEGSEEEYLEIPAFLRRQAN